MDKKLYEVQTRVFKALAHPTRIAALELMREGPICSCEIEPVLGLRQSNIAQHLAILRNSQLVTSYRDGTRVMYAVTDPRVNEIIDLVKAVMYEVLDETTQSLALAEDIAG